VITGTTITAKFTDDSKITGSAGCNHYGGEYLLDGANLSISSLFSTLMYCTEPEGVMEQEARYLGLFDSVRVTASTEIGLTSSMKLGRCSSLTGQDAQISPDRATAPGGPIGPRSQFYCTRQDLSPPLHQILEVSGG